MADFGTVREGVEDEDKTHVSTRVIAGTRVYMPPGSAAVVVAVAVVVVVVVVVVAVVAGFKSPLPETGTTPG